MVIAIQIKTSKKDNFFFFKNPPSDRKTNEFIGMRTQSTHCEILKKLLG